ncbi:MAG: response regulator transcription factor, partial [Clostridia bacterium]|nr:response regulator transcription factor [Clostridia bacterium]
MIKILIVEDEKPISDLIKLSLTKAGYSCKCAYDGEEAADMLDSNVFDLVLLDVMLPKADGFEVMEYIAPLGIPVIFITAKNSVADRVKGLRMGAEDYIVKPFEVLELLARVDVVLRRYHKNDAPITIAGLEIDPRSMQVRRDGVEIP